MENCSSVEQKDLTGGVALVTGASSGSGTRPARPLAGAGAFAAVAGRLIERTRRLEDQIRCNGRPQHRHDMAGGTFVEVEVPAQSAVTPL